MNGRRPSKPSCRMVLTGGGDGSRGDRARRESEGITCKLNGTRAVKRDEESGGILVPIARGCVEPSRVMYRH